MRVNGEPNFLNPPVIEVACGIQFEGLDDWKTPYYGLFWDRIRKEYSGCEEHPPLTRLRLEPGSGDELPPVLALPPFRRVLFIKPPGNFLIQLLPYRFIYNWRKVHDSNEYPRFDAPFQGLVKEWGEFQNFLAEISLPAPRMDLFELTYVNHIFGDGVSFPRDLWKYLNFYDQTPQARTARPATGLALQINWPLPDNLGTLVLDAKHGHRTKDQGEVLVLELSARGKATRDVVAMAHWFEVAHTAIVTTFDALTTEKAHILWGKK